MKKALIAVALVGAGAIGMLAALYGVVAVVEGGYLEVLRFPEDEE